MDRHWLDDLRRRFSGEGAPRRALLTGMAGAALAGGLAVASRSGVGAKPSAEKQCRKDAKKACKTACKGAESPFPELNRGQCIKACTAEAVAECGAPPV